VQLAAHQVVLGRLLGNSHQVGTGTLLMAILFFHDEKFGTITGENKGVLCQQLSQMARGTAFKNVVSMYWGRFNKSSCWVLANK